MAEERAAAQASAQRAAWRPWLFDPWKWLLAAGTCFMSTCHMAIKLDRDEGALVVIADQVLRGQVPIAMSSIRRHP